MLEISELKAKKLPELQELANTLKVPKYRTLKKLDLVYQILDYQAANPNAVKAIVSEIPKEAVSEPTATKTEERSPRPPRHKPNPRAKQAPREKTNPSEKKEQHKQEGTIEKKNDKAETTLENPSKRTLLKRTSHNTKTKIQTTVNKMTTVKKVETTTKDHQEITNQNKTTVTTVIKTVETDIKSQILNLMVL